MRARRLHYRGTRFAGSVESLWTSQWGDVGGTAAVEADAVAVAAAVADGEGEALGQGYP